MLSQILFTYEKVNKGQIRHKSSGNIIDNQTIYDYMDRFTLVPSRSEPDQFRIKDKITRKRYVDLMIGATVIEKEDKDETGEGKSERIGEESINFGEFVKPFIYNGKEYRIIPSIYSRYGENKYLDIRTAKAQKELYDKALNDMSTPGVTFPTVDDSLFIDKKIPYLRLLLAKGLIDPSTLLFDLSDKDKDKTMNDYGIDPDYQYYIKTSFSGNSSCVQNHSGSELSEMSINDIQKIYNDCPGKYFGLIVQKENESFAIFDELRCFCSGGEIMYVTCTNKTKADRRVYGFLNLYINKKLVLKACDIIQNQLDEFIKDIDDDFFMCPEDHYLRSHWDRIKAVCLNAYNCIKENKSLDGTVFRFDIIPNHDEDGFFVNEIENINCGGNSLATTHLITNSRKVFEKVLEQKSDNALLEYNPHLLKLVREQYNDALIEYNIKRSTSVKEVVEEVVEDYNNWSNRIVSRGRKKPPLLDTNDETLIKNMIMLSRALNYLIINIYHVFLALHIDSKRV